MNSKEFLKRFDSMNFENKIRYQLGSIVNITKINDIGIYYWGSIIFSLICYIQFQNTLSYGWGLLTIFAFFISLIFSIFNIIFLYEGIKFEEEKEKFLMKHSDIRKNKRGKK